MLVQSLKEWSWRCTVSMFAGFDFNQNYSFRLVTMYRYTVFANLLLIRVCFVCIELVEIWCSFLKMNTDGQYDRLHYYSQTFWWRLMISKTSLKHLRVRVSFYRLADNRWSLEKLAEVTPTGSIFLMRTDEVKNVLHWSLLMIFVLLTKADEGLNQSSSQNGKFSSNGWKPMLFYILGTTLYNDYTSWM